MYVYTVHPVVDNPLYDGLALADQGDLLNTWPKDWRANYKTWAPLSLASTWPTPTVIGHVREFNDYPCINLSYPAFSQRAVDLLGDILRANGEMLPVKHSIGIYYVYNCTTVMNCVDLEKSKPIKLKDGLVTSTENLVFVDEMLDGVTVFKIRTQLLELFCTQLFVDRVEEAGLQGFRFTPVWPLADGATYHDERYRIAKLSRLWKPRGMRELNIKGNTVVLRLYCMRKKASSKEISAADAVMSDLEKVLYDPTQQSAESYFGNVEGHDVVDGEIRVFLSAPDCDRLVAFLMPTFRSLNWPGKFHVVKRRGEYVDESAPEEYVPVHKV